MQHFTCLKAERLNDDSVVQCVVSSAYSCYLFCCWACFLGLQCCVVLKDGS